MSAVGTLTKLATEVVGVAAHAVTHPRETVASIAGHARGVASTVTGGEGRADTAATADPPAAGKARHEPGPPEPSVVPKPPTNIEPAEPAEPARSVEPSTTEPKAATRRAAHQGRGADPTDDWHDELDDGSDLNPATGEPHNAPAGDEPLVDPATAKAIRSESETMGKAADRPGE